MLPALPFYIASLCCYGGFFGFVVVRLGMHLQCKFRRRTHRRRRNRDRRTTNDKRHKQKSVGRCRCTANYKMFSHLFIAVFLFFRTCDFITCTLRCLESANLCQNFNADTIHVR